MIMDKYIDKIADAFLFREGTQEDENGTLQPVVTVGSIVWGIILRASIIVLFSFFFIQFFRFHGYWWLALFIFWFAAIYPGWKQFQNFDKKIKDIEENTLCGKCKYFESSGQLCKIYDEHITKEYIPCDGLDWEPTSFEEE